MVRPILPFIEYEINKQYITEFLCINRDKPRLQCDGKCHLAEELREATGNNSNEENPTIPSFDTREYPVSLINKDEFEFSNPNIELNNTYYDITVVKTRDFHSTLLRPPIMVVS